MDFVKSDDTTPEPILITVGIVNLEDRARECWDEACHVRGWLRAPTFLRVYLPDVSSLSPCDSYYSLKLKVWLKLKRCDGKVESSCVYKSFDVIKKLEVCWKNL